MHYNRNNNLRNPLKHSIHQTFPAKPLVCSCCWRDKEVKLGTLAVLNVVGCARYHGDRSARLYRPRSVRPMCLSCNNVTGQEFCWQQNSSYALARCCGKRYVFAYGSMNNRIGDERTATPQHDLNLDHLDCLMFGNGAFADVEILLRYQC